MRKALAVLAVAIASLTGCASGTAAPSAEVATSPEDQLRVAVEAFWASVLSGDIAKVLAYVSPRCTADQRSKWLVGIGIMQGVGKGATMKVADLKVSGSSGVVSSYTVVGGTEEIQRLMANRKGSDNWSLIDGKWYMADCE